MTVGQTMPRFELKATYQMAGRQLALTLQEVQTEQGDDALLCTANIHREVEEGNQQMRVNSILSMLDCWKTDLDEFSALVNQALDWTTTMYAESSPPRRGHPDSRTGP